MELGGFSAAEADELRRAIGFTRSQDRLNRMKEKLTVALKRNAVTDEAAEYIVNSLASFSLYGFPESHAISFALIAYASAWLKVHRTAVFYAALINNQPMGFYSVASLIQDGRRHGIKFLPPCIQNSDGPSRVDTDDTVRLGLTTVQGIRAKPLLSTLTTRTQRAFTSLADFLRRVDFNPKERRALAEAGALNVLAGHRRAALWQVESLESDDDLFRYAQIEETELSPLEKMTHLERLQADYSTLGLTVGAHPIGLMRSRLPTATPAASLKTTKPGSRVTVAGAVSCRQRPGTAKGFMFITLEDETGMANAIVRPALFEASRLVINLEPALLISGRLQNDSGVIHIMADEIVALPALELPVQQSHNYH